jgi:hypothetical protein
MTSGKYFSVEKCDVKTARRIQLWIICTIVIITVLITYSPMEYLFHYLGYRDSNGCPLLTLTGIPCPMCGMGRSFWALVTMNINDVFYYNPSGAFVYLFSGFALVYMLILSLFRYRLRLKDPLLKLWYIPVALLAIVWVLNILYGHHT